MPDNSVDRPLSKEMQDVLDLHNLYRCMHSVPLLVWDDALAQSAQAWADNGRYEHAPAQLRVVDGTRVGENIAWGSSVFTSGIDSTKAWYCEIVCTDPYGSANGPEDSKHDSEAIGHYTQLVWKASTKLGCGKGKAIVNGNQGDYWVCRYSSPGNVLGSFEVNVVTPVVGVGACPSQPLHAIANSCPANPNCPAYPLLSNTDPGDSDGNISPSPAAQPSRSSAASRSAARVANSITTTTTITAITTTTITITTLTTATTITTIELTGGDGATVIRLWYDFYVSSATDFINGQNSVTSIRKAIASITGQSIAKVTAQIHEKVPANLVANLAKVPIGETCNGAAIRANVALEVNPLGASDVGIDLISAGTGGFQAELKSELAAGGGYTGCIVVYGSNWLGRQGGPLGGRVLSRRNQVDALPTGPQSVLGGHGHRAGHHIHRPTPLLPQVPKMHRLPQFWSQALFLLFLLAAFFLFLGF